MTPDAYAEETGNIVNAICNKFEGSEICKFYLKVSDEKILFIYTGGLRDELDVFQRIGMLAERRTLNVQRLGRMRFNLFVVSNDVDGFWLRKKPDVVFYAKKIFIKKA